ncbi:MAG TPA: hypothetical protein VJS64_06120 [Pyrinomonadaceae bacterium]|nr:hypothetical protein [Pyrinomonadaceae bacterium]
MVSVQTEITKRQGLTPTREGAWIVNISKHLVTFAANSIGLSSLENILFAGKCGALLIKLSADETEQLTLAKVRAHARVCGISGPELGVYLEALRKQGSVDWDRDGQVYEILPFSRERVLETTSKIFASLIGATEVEKSLPRLLEFCLLRPRLQSEIKGFLSDLPERDSATLLEMTATFGLLGVELLLESTPFEKVYYNEYQFGEKDQAVKAGSALAKLDANQRGELSSLIEEVASKPGTPPESINISEEAKNFAIGLGLIEVSEVASPAGTARFLTLPRLPVPSVGTQTANLEDDIFHHSKMLLSSLRYGELRSARWRGKIATPYVLVRTLLERDRVGPCTAIGQDYVILESEGVIKTIHADHRHGNQFYMELRRREPAEVVMNLLKSDGGSSIDATSLVRNLELPFRYAGPESARPAAAKKTKNQSPEALRRFLEELRT